MSYQEDDADYVIANLNRANEALRARVAELEAQLARTQNSDEHNFSRWQKAEAQLAERDSLLHHASQMTDMVNAELADHKKLLLLAKAALEAYVDEIHTTEEWFELRRKAVAAINDSKLDGLILCDANPIGAVLVRRENREGIMFYSADMIPKADTIKDRFELITVYALRTTEN